MKNQSKKFILFLFIYIISFLSKTIKCDDNNNNDTYRGRCIYFFTKSGSEIINFYKYKNDKYKFNLNISETEKQKWFINLCNDTIYLKENSTDEKKYDSQIVYHDNEKNYRLTGAFLKLLNEEEVYITINYNNRYLYKPQSGSICDIYNKRNYSTSIIFENSIVSDEKYAEIYELPNINDCNSQMKLHFNIEYAKDYLILQKLLNDNYIFSGIIFIILGIYFCFFSFRFEILTKIIVCLVFGEITMFSIEIMLIGNSTSLKRCVDILIIICGVILGGIFAFLCLKKKKNTRLYFIILSFSSGFVNGIYVFDMCFIGTNCILTVDILIDCICIFTISFIGLMQIIPKHYIYYPPVIGSYTLVRGVSLFLYHFSDKMGYRDLQLLLYLVKRYENELVDKYLKNNFKYFWVYIILNTLILILSEILIYCLNRNKDNTIIIDDDDEEEDKSTELNGTSLNLNDSKESE